MSVSQTANRCLVCFVALLLVVSASSRATAVEPAKLQRIIVQPEKSVLAGARATQGLRVTGQYDDGTLRDVTAQCSFRSGDSAVVEVSEQGNVRPKANGETAITVTLADHTASVALTVSRIEDAAYNFRNDVLPVIEHLSCNQMGCHGSPKGKKRLQFSLFSADPHKDFLQITDKEKKLIDLQSPDRSWLLLKAICEEDHGGGDLTEEGSPAYNLLLDWIKQAAPEGRDGDPELLRVEVFPAERRMLPGEKQRLLVEAYYSDGTMRDVTELASFKSNEEAVAKSDKLGNVEATGYGEAVFMVSYGGRLTTSRVTCSQPMAVPFPDVPANNKLDELALAKLRSLNILPSELSSDAEFLRRVYLDVVGVLPTADEARSFLADASPDKRRRLIDALLERPEYADFYAVKWGDILQINRDAPAQLQEKGMWAYYRWLWNALDQNLPMDRFVREQLTARGSGYRNGPANFFRIGEGPQGMAEHTATAFLGVRLDCAHCHNHPFEQFTLIDNLGMAAFFTKVKLKRSQEQDEQIVYLADSGSIKNPETNQVAAAKYLGGDEVAETDLTGDPRAKLADWITSPSNPYFARHMANRVWTWLLGRGIIDEPDDFRSTNPASNPELLDYLAGEFVRSGYDLKAMFRLVLNSRTYQLAALPNAYNKHDRIHYSHYYLKRLTAEQLATAISQVTGVAEKYPGLPLGTRAIQLPDVSMRSEFLDLFGRPKRATPVESERTCDTHIGQSLQMISSEYIAAKLRDNNGRVAQLAATGRPLGELVDELYLTTLCRFPTEAERQVVLGQPIVDGQRREKLEDLLWVLVNTKEFLFNH